MAPRLALASVALQAGRSVALLVGNRENPVEKVITLLTDLKTQVEEEGKTEATAYDTFSCFCRDTTGSKSTSITDGQDSIDGLSASIQEGSASQAEKETELGERQGKQEEDEKELQETTTRCAAEAAEFAATIADLSKAVSSLQGAIKAIGDSKPAASLLALRSDAQRLPALAAALGRVKDPKQRAMLQQGVDPTDPEYKFHSQGIMDTLNGLLKEFEDNKATQEREQGIAKTSCDDLKQGIADRMSTNSEAMNTLKTDIDGLKSSIAKDREDLVQAESLLADDQLYLKDLTKRCEEKAKTWDQRSALRAGELQALSGALAVLQDRVQGADAAVNQRALLQRQQPKAPAPAARAAPSFVQLRAGRRAVERHEQVSADAASVGLRERRVQEQLRSEARRLGSPALSAIATSVAADPFQKVKGLIQGLIERLLKESTDEATKKGFCDTELGKATKNRDFRVAERNKLNAEIASLEAKKDTLDQRISELQQGVNETSTALDTATAARSEEKAANLNTTKQAREGLEAVKEAIAILKTFYKEASKGKVLLQASPVDEDAPAAAFDGAYTGQQASSKGILGLLDVIKADFERTLRTTAQDEKKAAEEFVDFDRTSKASIAEKEKGVELETEELESTGAAIRQKSTDLQATQDLLDAALKTMEDLKPMCIDNTMSFEERKKKREEEIAALKTALCHLDPEKVETECQ